QPGRLRAVIEDVAEVRAAAAALDLGADHAVARVLDLGDGVLVERLPEARPAGARLELGLGREERLPAADAAVGARVVVVPVSAGEGPLGALVARDLELLLRELRAPLGLGLDDLARGADVGGGRLVGLHLLLLSLVVVPATGEESERERERDERSHEEPPIIENARPARAYSRE